MVYQLFGLLQDIMFRCKHHNNVAKYSMFRFYYYFFHNIQKKKQYHNMVLIITLFIVYDLKV